MDAIYRGVADSENDLDDIAWELAYENFESYGGVNLMAEDNGYDPDTGEIIDYFGGMEDLKAKQLKTPLNPTDTFNDDPLRILRGIRFAITKGFFMTTELQCIVESYDYDGKMGVVSEERIREELIKIFKHDTLQSIKTLEQFSRLRDYIFTRTKLWLKPTTEQ